ncbi:protein CPR-5-like [Pyrus ussuriensis x Pyrus communis]|uniref:Protein CPR-5-like n=1 Tax=Pyrus ussuriensis x Pyrus communis TaxID=2448454 RepID=A0A5N5F2Q2_9ROSA|nr:protein CPR-5-like [Pyrus ussuriensis x Pyrus communis]
MDSTPSVPADQPDAADHENTTTTTTTTVDANPNPSNPAVPNSLPGDASPEKPIGRNKKKAKKRVLRDPSAASSSSSASISSGSSVRGTRVAGKRRTPKLVSTASRRNPNADEIAFRLGMSIAAFVAQILERNGELGGGMSSDHLAKICASAVRESLANDFGNTFDCFIRNFEESFGSTLRTLKSIKESSTENRGYISSHQNMDRSNLHVPHDEHDDCLRRESSSVIEDCHSEEIPHTNATLGCLNYRDEVQQNMLTNSLNLELSLHGQTNQLACVSPMTSESGTNQSILKTIGKSVMEQARANDLKTLELNLTMQRLKMKETQLDLHYDSNQLERSKFAMGISKQSFKAEKFKSQLEEIRHAELLQRCNDCLVFGLLVMAGFLMYGVYVYSYERLTEGTASCTSPSTKGSKSWLRWEAWDPMTSFNSWFNVLWCKVQVVSRALIGLLTIVAITFVFLHCSATAKRIMPVTYIVLLLGLLCGTAGKFCIDTLGGNGNIWVMWWEIFCALHFLCNVFTSTLYLILYGSVDASQGAKRKTRLPYCIRRVVFFAILFLLLPVFCGLLPFASLGEWKHHFVVWVTDLGYW